MQQIQFIGTTPNALVDLIDESVKKQLDELKKNFQPKTPNKYLTRQDVADMLQIDLSSVWNWTKKGVLTSYQISGRVYYKLDEVEQAIIKLKK